MVADNRESLYGRCIPIEAFKEPDKWLTNQQLADLVGEPFQDVTRLMHQLNAEGKPKMPAGIKVIVGFNGNHKPIFERRWWRKTAEECARKYREELAQAKAAVDATAEQMKTDSR